MCWHPPLPLYLESDTSCSFCKDKGLLRCPLKPSPGQKQKNLPLAIGCDPINHVQKDCTQTRQQKKCPHVFLVSSYFIHHPTQMIADKVHNTKLSWTRTTVLSSWCNHHYLSSLRNLPWWRRPLNERRLEIWANFWSFRRNTIRNPPGKLFNKNQVLEWISTYEF